MAAPNIVNVTTIIGKTAVLAITNSATAIVANSAASGKVFKVHEVYKDMDGSLKLKSADGFWHHLERYSPVWISEPRCCVEDPPKAWSKVLVKFLNGEYKVARPGLIWMVQGNNGAESAIYGDMKGMVWYALPSGGE